MSSISLFIIFVVIIAVLFLVINLLFAPHNPYQDKNSPFECGFHSFQQSRLPFNISFFIYALVYLLLDLEILLIFPYAVSTYVNSTYGLLIVLIFMIVITIGFVFELGKGALKISSKQDFKPNIKTSQSISAFTFLGKGTGVNILSFTNSDTKGQRKFSTRVAKLAYSIESHKARYFSDVSPFYANGVMQEKNTTHGLNPKLVTGFVDGEGTFMISLRKDPNYKTGWQVTPIFQVGIHKKDLPLLEALQSFFNGAGTVRDMGENMVIIMVRSLKEITDIIIPHFDKYPLITKKYEDYLLFKQVVTLIEQKEHLTQAGLEKIVAIKASLNLGLSDSLKEAFPNVNPVSRLDVSLDTNLAGAQRLKTLSLTDQDWISGFSSAEGSFLINIGKSTTHKTGSFVQLVFQITQHSRDQELMRSLVDLFGCGDIRIRGNYVDFICTKFSSIRDIIIPFFSEHPIVGVKSLDFKDWQKVANLMETKTHLTLDGLEQIRKIKSGMNTGRENN